MRGHAGLKYHCEYCSKPFVSKEKARSIIYQFTPVCTDSPVRNVTKDSTESMSSVPMSPAHV